MSDQEKIARLVQQGTELVDRTTKYLSTLPYFIECLEELISVVAVTSSLLESLLSTLSRFPNLNLGPAVFLGPLCEDVGKCSWELDNKIAAFESIGLTRFPRDAWILVMEGELQANALRRRLYVEKYRVRVLIEAVVLVSLPYLTKKEVELLGTSESSSSLLAERMKVPLADLVQRMEKREDREEKGVFDLTGGLTNKVLQTYNSTRNSWPTAEHKVQFKLQRGPLQESGLRENIFGLNSQPNCPWSIRQSAVYHSFDVHETVGTRFWLALGTKEELRYYDELVQQESLLRDHQRDFGKEHQKFNRGEYTSAHHHKVNNTTPVPLDEYEELQQHDARWLGRASDRLRSWTRSFKVTNLRSHPGVDEFPGHSHADLLSRTRSHSRNLYPVFRLLLPLSMVGNANGTSIPSTATIVDPSNWSSGGPSAGDIIGAISVAVVGTVIWHCVKRSPNRRPYLIISLLVSGWTYSMVLNDQGGMWPVSSLWICSLLNALVLLSLDMLDLKLGLSYGISVVLAGSLLDGALSPFAPSTHYLTYFPHATVVCMFVGGIAIRTVRLVVGSLSPNAVRTIQPWLPQAMLHRIGDSSNDVQNVEEGSVMSTGRIAAIEDARV